MARYGGRIPTATAPALTPRWAVVLGRRRTASESLAVSLSAGKQLVGVKCFRQRRARRDSMRETGRREGEPPERPRRGAEGCPMARDL